MNLPADTLEATRMIREMYPPGAYPLTRFGVLPRPQASTGPRAETVLVDPTPDDPTKGGKIVTLGAAADLSLANELTARHPSDPAARMEALAQVAPGDKLDITPATRVNPRFSGYAVPSAKFEGTTVPDGFRTQFGPGNDEMIIADPDWQGPPPEAAQPSPPPPVVPTPDVRPVVAQWNGQAPAAPAPMLSAQQAREHYDPVSALAAALNTLIQGRPAVQSPEPVAQPAAATPQPASEPWGGVAPSPPGVDPKLLKDAEREGAQKLWKELGLFDVEYHPTSDVQEPKWQAVFAGAMGQQTGWYHRVYAAGEVLLLIYDTRFRFGSQYAPPLAEGGTPLKITFANAETSPSYNVLYDGLHFALGCFDVLILHFEPQTAQAQMEAEALQNAVVPPPQHPSQQNLINVLGGAGLS